jgi:predicted signal transduction protein with EAL and GGDEF domain
VESEVRVGFTRLAGRTPSKEKRRAVKGLLLYTLPCIGSVLVQQTDTLILAILLILWLIARHLQFRPRRRMRWANALRHYRGQQAEMAQLWMSSLFWYGNIAMLPYLYMAYLVLSRSIFVPGHSPQIVAAIIVAIAQGAEILFFGFTNVIPGYRAFRAAQRVVPEKETTTQ